MTEAWQRELRCEERRAFNRATARTARAIERSRAVIAVKRKHAWNVWLEHTVIEAFEFGVFFRHRGTRK